MFRDLLSSGFGRVGPNFGNMEIQYRNNVIIPINKYDVRRTINVGKHSFNRILFTDDDGADESIIPTHGFRYVLSSVSENS